MQRGFIRAVVVCFYAIGLPLFAHADELMFTRGQAIVSVPRHDRSPLSQGTSPALARLSRDSFASLEGARLSTRAYQVSAERPSVARVQDSIRYRASRNPCLKPRLRRLLRTNPALRCEPNWEVRLSLTPDDTLLGSLYAMSAASTGRINAREAWDTTTGSSSVVVAVLDTGIDYTHDDLITNIWSNPGETAANSIDDDGNGYIDDVYGIDTYNHDSNPMEDHYHGTHVAGTIGAVGNNGLGVVGVAWSVKLLGCKFLSSSGSGSTAGAIECLNYINSLKNDGVNIVASNNSWGGGGQSSALADAIAESRDRGIVFVAAAGNNGTNNDTSAYYPSGYDVANVVSVAAIDSNGALASFSNYGATTVDLGAPGVNILSTYPGDLYASLDGTSMAAPHVAGAIALLAANDPTSTYSERIAAILSSTRLLDSLAGKCATGGTLDVNSALLGVTPTPTPTPTSTATATPTSPPAPTLTPTPEPPLPSPSPTTPATESPTPDPSEPPSEDDPPPVETATPEPTATSIATPNPRNVRLRISVRAGRKSALVACTAREESRSTGLSNPLTTLSISLVTSSGRRMGTASTDEHGIALFAVRTSRAASLVRCRSVIGSRTVVSQPALLRSSIRTTRRSTR